jgi:LEA14-like dessication related protein
MSARRRVLLAGVAAVTVVATGCAALALKEPLNVNLVGLEPLEGQGMEARFAAKVRVQNPNDTPIEFNGISVTLDVRGDRFATGVSDATGTVPRFGETVLTIPVSVPISAFVRQLVSLSAAGERPRLDYRIRGRLNSTTLGSHTFDSRGELRMPGAKP